MIASAPGKAILFGEHSVVYGKTAIAASIGLRTYVQAERKTPESANNGWLTLQLVDCIPRVQLSWSRSQVSQSAELFWKCKEGRDQDTTYAPLENIDPTVFKSLNVDFTSNEMKQLSQRAFLYLYFELFGKHPSGLPSLSISVASTIPPGAGLGSSAAFSVALSAIFLQVAGSVNPTEITAENRATINNVAFEVEKIMHGKPSGVDNTVSTYGGVVAFKEGEKSFLPHPANLSLIISDTKVSRSTRDLVILVRRKYEAQPTIIKPVLEAMDAVAVNARNLLSVANNQDGNMAKSLGTLMSINQNLLEILGVSGPEIHKICKFVCCNEDGLPFASKLTGAGRGGCVITLENCFSDQQVKLICETLRGSGFDCYNAELGSPGVLYHRSLSGVPLKIKNAFEK